MIFSTSIYNSNLEEIYQNHKYLQIIVSNKYLPIIWYRNQKSKKYVNIVFFIDIWSSNLNKIRYLQFKQKIKILIILSFFKNIHRL